LAAGSFAANFNAMSTNSTIARHGRSHHRLHWQTTRTRPQLKKNQLLPTPINFHEVLPPQQSAEIVIAAQGTAPSQGGFLLWRA